MQLFYVPEVSDDDFYLDETESKHVVRVLRLGKGDVIFCTNGTGNFFRATITDANPKKCLMKIIKPVQQVAPKSYNIHIAIAPVKNNDRLEWFLEKATELGIDEISLLLCDNSERKTVKPDRLEKVIISAMKQSVKAYLPRLNDMIPFDKFIEGCKSQQKFIAHCRKDQLPHLKNQVQQNTSVVVLIGPEGDFSTNEIELAMQHQYLPVSLGDARLRTETAGIAACHIVNLSNV